MAARSSSLVPGRSRASRTTGTMARRCSREASSGTTPPYLPWVIICEATTEERTASPSSTTAAAVSSQEDSMPRMRTSSTLARVHCVAIKRCWNASLHAGLQGRLSSVNGPAIHKLKHLRADLVRPRAALRQGPKALLNRGKADRQLHCKFTARIRLNGHRYHAAQSGSRYSVYKFRLPAAATVHANRWLRPEEYRVGFKKVA